MDFYTLLGISKNSTPEEIKRAYRDKARIFHPDRGGNQKDFNNIHEAYQVLIDPVKKRNYDLIHPSHRHKFKAPKRDSSFSIINIDIGEVDLWEQMVYDKDNNLIDPEIEKIKENNKPKPKPKPKENKFKNDPNFATGSIKNVAPSKKDIWGESIEENDWIDIFANRYETESAPSLR